MSLMDDHGFLDRSMAEFVRIWRTGRKATLHLECGGGEATAALQTFPSPPVHHHNSPHHYRPHPPPPFHPPNPPPPRYRGQGDRVKSRIRAAAYQARQAAPPPLLPPPLLPPPLQPPLLPPPPAVIPVIPPPLLPPPIQPPLLPPPPAVIPVIPLLPPASQPASQPADQPASEPASQPASSNIIPTTDGAVTRRSGRKFCELMRTASPPGSPTRRTPSRSPPRSPSPGSPPPSPWSPPGFLSRGAWNCYAYPDPTCKHS
jgi:hypothetical protein